LTELVDSANAVGGAAALEHISNVLYAGTDANYLRRQHELRGSSEGMVDATIALFRSGMS
jgi:carboxylate-amine ligase